MKNKAKRLISIIIAVCILSTVLPVISGLTANADDPELSSRCETVIDIDGKDTTFGSALSDIRINTRIKFDTARDFSGFDLFELNVYIENAAALKSFVNNDQKLNLCFGSQSSDKKEKQKVSKADIASQLTENGWNTVTVKKEAFSDGANWIAIWRIFIGFSDEEAVSGLPNSLKNMTFKYKNICDVCSTPEINDGGSVICEDAALNTLGESAESLISDTANRFTVQFAAKDISDMDIIKADLNIPDYAAFTTFLSDKAIKVTFNSENGSATADIPKVFAPNSSVTGWYTVLFALADFIKTANFDFKTVTGVKFEISAESGAVLGDNYAFKFGFCNLRGFTYSNFNEDNSFGNKTTDITDIKAAIVPDNSYGSFDIALSGYFAAIKNADYIEADLYISDAAKIRSAFSGTDSLDLSLGNGSSTLTFKGVEKQISFNGLNHIILPISGAQDNGFDKNGSFTGISFKGNFANPSDTNPAAGEFILVNNVTASKKTNGGNLKFDKLADLSGGMNANLLDTFSESAKNENITATNIAGVKFIEFDVYIQNYSAFKTELAAKGITEIDLRIASENGSVTADIIGLINKNGWNHLAVAYTKFSVRESGTFDLNAVNGWSISYIGNTSANTGLLKGQTVEIKNLTAANIVDPTVPEDAAAVISAEGKSGVYGGSYADIATDSKVNLSEPIDATLGGLLEFDFFVGDYDSFKKMLSESSTPLYLALGTSATPNKALALYDFTKYVTDSGWNHIELSTQVYSTVYDDDTVDLKTVYNTFLTFNSNTSANSYAVLEYNYKNIVVSSDPIDTIPDAPDYPYMISKDGIGPKTWGDKYSWARDRFILNYKDNPLDLSQYDYIEFDIFIRNYDEFKSAVQGKRINLVFASSDDKYKTRKLYDFENQITQSGWNHVAIQMESKWFVDSAFTSSSIKWIYINFQDGGDAANPIANTLVRIANIGVDYAEYSKLPELPKHEILISQSGSKAKTWGDNYNWTIDRIYVNLTESPIDLSDVDQFEFDIYIENLDEFKSAVKGKRINFALASSDVKTLSRVRFDFENQVTKSGWNHIVLDKGAKWFIDSSFTYNEVKWVMIFFQDGHAVPNPIAKTVTRIANICGSYAPYRFNPELPDNVVAQLGNTESGTDSRANTVGEYYHYTLDRIYREKISPTDFSQTPIIEFDIYIGDYEKFLESENDPNDKQKSKLALQFSSTPPALWGQYSAPRAYYSSELVLAPYIKQGGWNHVTVGRNEFVAHNHGVDWSALTAYVVYYKNSSNYYPYKNPNSNLFVKIANIVNTGVVANIPKDSEKDLTPDKDAVYISSIEGLSDEYGAWNIQDPILSEDYKTAGTVSLLKKITYQNEPEDTPISYIFDTTVDISDLKTLKVDFFIDLPQHLNKPTNNFEICLSNSRLNYDNYYGWDMYLSGLKQGWNEISLDINDAKIIGNPDLKTVKVIVFRFTKLDLSSETYEEMTYGIDNLRYISSTGNKTLKVASLDDEADDDSTDDNSQENVEDENDNAVSNKGKEQVKEEPAEVEETEDIEPDEDDNGAGKLRRIRRLKKNKDGYVEPVEDYDDVFDDIDIDSESEDEPVLSVLPGRVKYKKINHKISVTDWLYGGIIMGAEAFVVAAGVALFIIIHRKKRKKLN